MVYVKQILFNRALFITDYPGAVHCRLKNKQMDLTLIRVFYPGKESVSCNLYSQTAKRAGMFNFASVIMFSSTHFL